MLVSENSAMRILFKVDGNVASGSKINVAILSLSLSVNARPSLAAFRIRRLNVMGNIRGMQQQVRACRSRQHEHKIRSENLDKHTVNEIIYIGVTNLHWRLAQQINEEGRGGTVCGRWPQKSTCTLVFRHFKPGLLYSINVYCFW